jgi:hypothetical protein
MQDIDQVADMAESAAGWLEIAERWTGFHTRNHQRRRSSPRHARSAGL